jgi:hypothetical protein
MKKSSSRNKGFAIVVVDKEDGIPIFVDDDDEDDNDEEATNQLLFVLGCVSSRANTPGTTDKEQHITTNIPGAIVDMKSSRIGFARN